jgi:rod shape-determining protein MreD
MNNVFSVSTVRFITLLFAQVLILNHVCFLGYINPYIYILFIALFSVKNNRAELMLLSFLLGLSVDLFLDTGGIHAAASVFIAFLRPVILKASFGIMYDHQTIKFNTIEFSSKLVYFSILAILHHTVLFTLEIFDVSKLFLLFQKVLFSSIFTVLLCIVVTVIFSRKNK